MLHAFSHYPKRSSEVIHLQIPYRLNFCHVFVSGFLQSKFPIAWKYKMLLCLFILGQELLEDIYLLLQLYYCLNTEYLTKIKRPIITLFLFYLRIYQVNFTLWLINESEGWIKCRKRNELMCDNNEGGRSRCHPPFTVPVQSLTSKLEACYFLIFQKRSGNVQPADVHLDFCHVHH